ncbi:hypothetical protein K6Y31_03360 [Motilimonas cestriensis]|uniref:DUF1232 domain-containing protein n=1 Tax=Motilimonas cestriensis TaxID=2742685 RepID=A0ABS8W5P3_9GAMM|nr:hypothetical protein [Motilimonas cestriensis]MCE2593848.1 hypothetical protein [Motilimonas cestriensis]
MSQSVSKNELWKKLKQVKGTKEVSIKALLLFYVLSDDDTPIWVKAIVVVALAYLINPADPLGVDPFVLIDDIAVMSTAITSISSNIKPKHHKQATLQYKKL